MRIVEYDGSPVRRQRRVDGGILVTFYDGRQPVVVSPQEWERKSQSVYFDDPTIKRRDAVRRAAVAR